MFISGLRFGIVLALLATPGMAQDAKAQVGVKQIELLQGWRTAAGTHMAAIRITLEDGWKTYWRAPGGNGIPPSFSWDGSENLDSVKFHWPSPKVFAQYGIRTIGYKGEFILPIEVKSKVANQPVTLKTQVELGVCNEVCVPITARIQTKLSVDETTHKPEIEMALAARPRTAKESDVQSVSCQVAPIEGGVNITARISFKDAAPKVLQSVIEYPGPDLWIEQVALENTGNTIMAQAELVSFSNKPFELDQNILRLTLIGKKQSIEIKGCSTPS
jgi:DsbC/DsbD-like thiol-disulfide interchange protein